MNERDDHDDGTTPCPSCGGRGQKFVLARRRLVAVPADEPVEREQQTRLCGLCVGSGVVAA